MKAPTQIKIPINDLTSSITIDVTITGRKTWAIRHKIGTTLIKLAAYIMRMNVEINIKKDKL